MCVGCKSCALLISHRCRVKLSKLDFATISNYQPHILSHATHDQPRPAQLDITQLDHTLTITQPTQATQAPRCTSSSSSPPLTESPLFARISYPHGYIRVDEELTHIQSAHNLYTRAHILDDYTLHRLYTILDMKPHTQRTLAHKRVLLRQHINRTHAHNNVNNADNNNSNDNNMNINRSVSDDSSTHDSVKTQLSRVHALTHLLHHATYTPSHTTQYDADMQCVRDVHITHTHDHVQHTMSGVIDVREYIDVAVRCMMMSDAYYTHAACVVLLIALTHYAHDARVYKLLTHTYTHAIITHSVSTACVSSMCTLLSLCPCKDAQMSLTLGTLYEHVYMSSSDENRSVLIAERAQYYYEQAHRHALHTYAAYGEAKVRLIFFLLELYLKEYKRSNM